jgi:hypothetical protein
MFLLFIASYLIPNYQENNVLEDFTFYSVIHSWGQQRLRVSICRFFFFFFWFSATIIDYDVLKMNRTI